MTATAITAPDVGPLVAHGLGPSADPNAALAIESFSFETIEHQTRVWRSEPIYVRDALGVTNSIGATGSLVSCA